jgi:hypothetical protein
MARSINFKKSIVVIDRKGSRYGHFSDFKKGSPNGKGLV